MIKKVAFILALAFLVTTTIANATLLTGIATDNGNTTDIGIYDSGEIRYYVPLQGEHDGTYGVTNYGGGKLGQVVDYSGSPINGDLMHMYLYFDIPTNEVGHTISLTAEDLDLKDGNDPYGFFEELTLYGQGVGLPSDTFQTVQSLDSLANVQVDKSDPNYPNLVTYEFSNLNIQPGGGDFWLDLGFRAYSEDLSSGRCWKNTQEHLSVQMETSPVPEPASMLLLGTGLVGLAGFRKKFKK